MNKLTFEHIERAFTEHLWKNASKLSLPARYKEFVIKLSHINKKIINKNKGNVEAYVDLINTVIKNKKGLYIVSEAYHENSDLHNILIHDATEIGILENINKVVTKTYVEYFSNQDIENNFNPKKFANILAGLYLYPRAIDIAVNDMIHKEYVEFLNKNLINYNCEYTADDLTLKTKKLLGKHNKGWQENKGYEEFLDEIQSIATEYYSITDTDPSDFRNSLENIVNEQKSFKQCMNIFSIKIDDDNLNKVILGNLIHDTTEYPKYYTYLIDNPNIRKAIELYMIEVLKRLMIFPCNTLKKDEMKFIEKVILYGKNISEVNFKKAQNFLNEILSILWQEDKDMVSGQDAYQEVKNIIYKNGAKKIKINHLNCDCRVDALLFEHYHEMNALDIIELSEKDVNKDRFIKKVLDSKNLFSIHIPEMNLKAELSKNDNVLVNSKLIRKYLNFENESLSIYQKYKNKRVYVIHMRNELKKDKRRVIDAICAYMRKIAKQDHKFGDRLTHTDKLYNFYYVKLIEEISDILRISALHEKMELKDSGKSTEIEKRPNINGRKKI